MLQTIDTGELQHTDTQEYIVLMNHMHTISHDDFDYASIDPNISNMYVGDFHGLLLHLGLLKKYLYYTTLLNGMRTSSEYDGTLTTIKIPGRNTMKKIDRVKDVS